MERALSKRAKVPYSHLRCQLRKTRRGWIGAWLCSVAHQRSQPETEPPLLKKGPTLGHIKRDTRKPVGMKNTGRAIDMHGMGQFVR